VVAVVELVAEELEVVLVVVLDELLEVAMLVVLLELPLALVAEDVDVVMELDVVEVVVVEEDVGDEDQENVVVLKMTGP